VIDAEVRNLALDGAGAAVEHLAVARLRLPAPEYARLTFPAYRCLLDKSDRAVAVGARRHGEAVGLGLAAVDPASGAAAILSIAVAAHCRRQGIGTALLQGLESALRPRYHGVGAVMTDKTAAFPVLQRMLERQGWSLPAQRMLICQTNLRCMLEAPWMNQPPLSAAFTIFPWRELSEPEAAALREKRDFDYPDGLSPFQLDEPFEPVSSLGLRFEGKVAGWIITHLLEPATIRYSVMFVRAELQRRARAVALLVESIKRFGAHPLGHRVTATFAVNVNNAPMMAFAERRLKPYLTAMYHSYQCTRSLEMGDREAVS
jgi:GNAT superfamily N-acetyltransferase